MPTKRVPLVGVPNTRNIDPINSFTKDQIFKSCLFDVIDNPVTRNRTVYVSKRPGFKTGSTINTNYLGIDCEDNYGFVSLSGPCTVWKDSGTDLQVYVSTVFAGSVDLGLIYEASVTKAIINGEENYLIGAGPGGMYYVGTTGMSGGVTFTADTNSNTTLTNVSSLTGLVVGQLISGTDIAAGTRIATISAPTTVTITIAATGTGSGRTITRERMSKVIDADAPTQVIGPMIEMDGYVFVAERGSRKVYQSDINSIASWTATSFITANLTVGYNNGLARLRNNIIATISDSLQFFYNAGNASGSVLSPQKDSAKRFGVSTTPGGIGTGINFRSYSYVDDLMFVVYEGIYMITAGGMQDITDTVLQRLVANTIKYQIVCRAFRFLGKYYFYVAKSDGAWQYIYDVKSGVWCQPGFTNVAVVSKHLGDAVYTPVNGILHEYPWVGVGQTPVYQDDGASYTMTIQTSGIDHDTPKRKFVSRIELDSDVQASGTATLEASDDDYATFYTLGTFDLTKTRPFITRCGSYVGKRAYRLTHSANTAFRASALYIDYTVASR